MNRNFLLKNLLLLLLLRHHCVYFIDKSSIVTFESRNNSLKIFWHWSIGADLGEKRT